MSDLLVPLACVPETLPAGLPAAHPDQPNTAGQISHTRSGLACIEARYWDDSRASFRADQAPGWCIDLSPPPVDAEGNPTRLDALPWALGVLERRDTGEMHDPAEAVLEVARFLRSGLPTQGLWHDFAGTDDPPPWPSLVGMDADTAQRVVVTAALRARVGLGVGDV